AHGRCEREEIPMRAPQADGWTRRRFLGGLTVAGTAGLLGVHPRPVVAEPPPETTRIRLYRYPSICAPHLYLAQEFLPSEGFTEVHYVEVESGLFTMAVVTGEVDLALNFVGPLIIRVEAGDPIVLMAGGHIGCFELVGTNRVRTIQDLKGKIVAVNEL